MEGLDRAAVEALLLDAYPWARSLALMLTRNGFEADDLVQEAMSSFLRKPPQVVTAATVHAWLRTAIVRDASRRRRRAASELKAFGRLFVQPPPVPATSQPSDDMLQAVRRLPPKQRACIVLRYVQDQSEEQIAEILGIAPGTVKAHLAQARERLRDLLGD
ncbi:MAG TPA: RNA polymerase sigma factor [Actinomycetota bacterium]|nr:RNA polymerase sigma factor [Actinomycetota bacterium]